MSASDTLKGLARSAALYVAREAQLVLIAALVIALVAAPAAVSLGNGSPRDRGLVLPPGLDITVGRELGLEGYLVTANGGDDSLYQNVSVAELEAAVTPLGAVPWSTGFRERVEAEGAAAYFSAYFPEYVTFGYFVGPAEIITRLDVGVWRLTLAPNNMDPTTGLRFIDEATPLDVAGAAP
jgi:hypothetical protein